MSVDVVEQLVPLFGRILHPRIRRRRIRRGSLRRGSLPPLVRVPKRARDARPDAPAR